ncbi:MAG: hypothetical protein AAF416_17980 [Pseudomonadota bacterium]
MSGEGDEGGVDATAERSRWPWLRVLVGVITAPIILTGIAWGVAFLVAGFTEATRIGVFAVAENTMHVFAIYAGALTIAAAIPGVVALGLLRWRGFLIWLGLGAALSAIASAGLAVIGGTPLLQAAGLGAIYGLITFALIRLIGGVSKV